MGLLEKVVQDYKYLPKKDLVEVLAELVVESLRKEGLEDSVVVPLPTITRHIRERGFDHMKVLYYRLVDYPIQLT